MTKEFIALERERIKAAWEGRISGCPLSKLVEMISIFRISPFYSHSWISINNNFFIIPKKIFVKIIFVEL
tara:strand:+ start:2461 stop:2670 length:210 start_codon:yes stop_codon:yes gene_type:complete